MIKLKKSLYHWNTGNEQSTDDLIMLMKVDQVAPQSASCPNKKVSRWGYLIASLPKSLNIICVTFCRQFIQQSMWTWRLIRYLYVFQPQNETFGIVYTECQQTPMNACRYMRIDSFELYESNDEIIVGATEAECMTKCDSRKVNSYSHRSLFWKI